MKGKNSYIITRFIIIALMAVICLPCPLRQEIKQVLDIPVEQTNQLVEQGETAICQSVPIEEAWHSGENQADLSGSVEDIPAIEIPSASCSAPILLWPHPSVTPVPIYILHEQYLI